MKKRLLTTTKDFEAIVASESSIDVKNGSSIDQGDGTDDDEVLPSEFGFIYF